MLNVQMHMFDLMRLIRGGFHVRPKLTNSFFFLRCLPQFRL